MIVKFYSSGKMATKVLENLHQIILNHISLNFNVCSKEDKDNLNISSQKDFQILTFHCNFKWLTNLII